jgi:hypothetical protein
MSISRFRERGRSPGEDVDVDDVDVGVGVVIRRRSDDDGGRRRDDDDACPGRRKDARQHATIDASGNNARAIIVIRTSDGDDGFNLLPEPLFMVKN